MSRFGKLFNKVTDTQIRPGDETQDANNLRNKLADSVNPLLEEYVNPSLPENIQLAIPKLSVADEKQYFQELPENMAAMGMTGPKRFSKVFGEKPQGYGTVDLKPTAENIWSDAQNAKMAKDAARRVFNKDYVDSGLVQQKRSTLPAAEFQEWLKSVVPDVLKGE